MVRPLKPWLSIDDQIRRLRDRGMLLASEERAAWALESIGYYRLSGYWYPYREMNPAGNGQRLDTFSHGTAFDEVLALYEFDRSLKLLVQQGIERVEIAGAVPCLVDTLTLAQNGPENARDHHAEEHLHR